MVLPPPAIPVPGAVLDSIILTFATLLIRNTEMLRRLFVSLVVLLT
jgi:hypothetical protein